MVAVVPARGDTSSVTLLSTVTSVYRHLLSTMLALLQCKLWQKLQLMCWVQGQRRG